MKSQSTQASQNSQKAWGKILSRVSYSESLKSYQNEVCVISFGLVWLKEKSYTWSWVCPEIFGTRPYGALFFLHLIFQSCPLSSLQTFSIRLYHKATQLMSSQFLTLYESRAGRKLKNSFQDPASSVFPPNKADAGELNVNWNKLISQKAQGQM